MAHPCSGREGNPADVYATRRLNGSVRATDSADAAVLAGRGALLSSLGCATLLKPEGEVADYTCDVLGSGASARRETVKMDR